MARTSTATRKEECGSREAWTEKDLFSTISSTLRCKGSNFARMRAASIDVGYKDAKKLGQKGVEQLSSLAFYGKTKPENNNCEEKWNHDCFLSRALRKSPHDRCF
jgi:hypothetical protein